MSAAGTSAAALSIVDHSGSYDKESQAAPLAHCVSCFRPVVCVRLKGVCVVRVVHEKVWLLAAMWWTLTH